jgi:hypothetical protein
MLTASRFLFIKSVIINHFGKNPKKGGSPPSDSIKIVILIKEALGIEYQKFEIEVKLNNFAEFIIIAKMTL